MYRVVPMVGAAIALQEKRELASDWSASVAVGSQTEQPISCYFNRGIVASQWLTRLLPSLSDPKEDTTEKGHELVKSIGSPGNTSEPSGMAHTSPVKRNFAR